MPVELDMQATATLTDNVNNIDARNGTWNRVGGNQTNVHVDHITTQIFNQITNSGKLTILVDPTKSFGLTYYIVGAIPRYALKALFDVDVTDRTICLSGTRTKIINQIYIWLNGESHHLKQDHGVRYQIFWINGSAGTGKTTIAFTIAHLCRDQNIPCVTFFCSRDDADCSNPKLIFTTVAYQLRKICPPYRELISNVLQHDPDIGHSDLSYQLETLIVKPLRAVGKSFPPCVVIIDALDECKDNSTISTVLSSLSRHVDQLPLLKFLITSRPERNINTAFEPNALGWATRRLLLHEVELSVVKTDIELYLATEIPKIGKYYRLGTSEWPVNADIKILAGMAAGLFIFASTSVKFIQDSSYDDPKDQLMRLVSHVDMIYEKNSPQARLDRLYIQILEAAYPEIAPSLSRRLKLILGSIVLLRDPLAPDDLGRLLNGLGTSNIDVRATLLRLHSIVLVPEENNRVIRLLHPSFFDFLINTTRCTNIKFQVDARIQHAYLSQGCLAALKYLRRNMPQVDSTTRLNSEIPDLPSRLNHCIPLHIQYACRHWASHLTECDISDIMIDLLSDFCTRGMLFWVEVCSLLGILRDALISLEAAQRILILLPVSSIAIS